jgi:DNA-binding transcriptional regulator YhcF (GntR family)
VNLVLYPDEPATQQIVDHISRMIVLGLYRSGDDLPSAAALSTQLGVTRTTVQEAYSLLEDRGVTTAVRGGPTTIAQGADTRQHSIRLGVSPRLSPIAGVVLVLARDQRRLQRSHRGSPALAAEVPGELRRNRRDRRKFDAGGT